MNRIETTFICSTPVERTWEVLSDFAGFLNWASGGVGEIRIEGNGVGMIRHLNMGSGELAEKLVLCDEAQRRIGYELVYGEPIGMRKYSAIVSITHGEDGTELNWVGEFDVAEPGSEDSVADSLNAAWRSMTSALEAYVLSQEK